MNFWFLLGQGNSSVNDTGTLIPQPTVIDGIFKTSPTASAAIIEIANFLNQYLVGFTIVLCVAAAITAIILSAAMNRAEDLKKADDYKRKLVGMLVTVLIVIVLVWITGWLLVSYDKIIEFFQQGFNF